MINKLIYENGNGGIPEVKNLNIIYTESLNMLVLYCLFGGNVEKNTSTQENTELYFNDWWGNFKSEQVNKWVNSETERTLRQITISQKGKVILENAVKKDLKRLEVYGNITVQVVFPAINKVKIIVTLTQKQTKDNQITIVWDNTLNEVIELR